MNNQIIPFKTDKGEFLAVEVPEDAVEIDIEGGDLCYKCEFGSTVFGKARRLIMLGISCTIIATSTDITEKQAAEIMPNPMTRSMDDQKGFMIDVMDTEIYTAAKIAFTSLMQSIGCDMSKQYVILRREVK